MARLSAHSTDPPTIIEELEYTMPDDRQLDGVSLLPFLRGGARRGPFLFPIAFWNEGMPCLVLLPLR